MSEPVCAGPFVDARDCPVHGPQIRNEQKRLQDDAIAAAERRGEQRILREVAKLPSPVSMLVFKGYDRWHCAWCGKQWGFNETHPDNGCLWPRAQAAKE